jgi:hypothetical protein
VALHKMILVLSILHGNRAAHATAAFERQNLRRKKEGRGECRKPEGIGPGVSAIKNSSEIDNPRPGARESVVLATPPFLRITSSRCSSPRSRSDSRLQQFCQCGHRRREHYQASSKCLVEEPDRLRFLRCRSLVVELMWTRYLVGPRRN